MLKISFESGCARGGEVWREGGREGGREGERKEAALCALVCKAQPKHVARIHTHTHTLPTHPDGIMGESPAQLHVRD